MGKGGGGAMAEVRALMAAGAGQGYQSDVAMTRLSHKMFGCTPAALQPDLLDQLAEVLQAHPQDLQACIRPGCPSPQTLNLKPLSPPQTIPRPPACPPSPPASPTRAGIG